MSLTFYLNILMSGLLTGLVYGLSALGLALIFTVTRLVNLAHGGLMAVGLWGAATLAARHGADPLLAMPIVAAALFLGAFLTHRLLIKRVADAPEHRQTLLMLGLALVLAAGAAALPGAVGTIPHGGDGTADGLGFGPLLLDRIEFRAALMAGIVTVLLVLFFNLSRAGKAIRACADNPFGARVVGLNLSRLQAVTFGLGAAVTGIAGCLLAHAGSGTPPAPNALALDFLTLGLIVALTGGLGNIGGALLGGLLVGVAEALAGALLTPSLKELGGCAVLLLVLALRPHGLLGQNS